MAEPGPAGAPRGHEPLSVLRQLPTDWVDPSGESSDPSGEISATTVYVGNTANDSKPIPVLNTRNTKPDDLGLSFNYTNGAAQQMHVYIRVIKYTARPKVTDNSLSFTADVAVTFFGRPVGTGRPTKWAEGSCKAEITAAVDVTGECIKEKGKPPIYKSALLVRVLGQGAPREDRRGGQGFGNRPSIADGKESSGQI